jgi:putative heme-binding domain-containing protein
MLIPGFTVEELPVKLPNVNNLRFAPDGSLTALGYNGKVWQLRDTDGDGLEDNATVWWDKAPFTVPVGMCWSTHGLFVSSSGKVSLLRDTTGDGMADTEEVVASGWTEKDVASGNVDATGVTMDTGGNLYFGLLTANYANAYRLKKVQELSATERDWLKSQGKDIPADPEEVVSLYDLNGQRGSVQKWNAQTRQLETIATGVRVPYQFAFNRAGDLFMTDQEGETWMPNGNPLDELNHIVPGRNYGFPPRHERWLPDLVSEPPVVGFGPQHQSTCGFVFNEPRGAINLGGRGSRRAASNQSQGLAGASPYRGGALPAAPAQGLFGPAWWEGDAIVTGQSRGKLWRVRLVKTEHGYVGKEFLIARFPMLTTDVTISPQGDLYVSCHSGLPDWGTGPNGEGKIFRIRYTDREAPQPVLAWSSAKDQVSVAFDRPLPDALTNATVAIEAGANVSPADKLEVLKPPYRAVMELEAQPRRQLTTGGVRMGDDPSVLVFAVESLNQPAPHALTIGLPPELARRYAIESFHLGFDLSGVEVTGAIDEHRLKLPGGNSVGVLLRGRLVWNSGLTAKGFRTIRPVTILSLDSQAARGLSRGSDYLKSLHDEVFSSSFHELTFRTRYSSDGARKNLHLFSRERLFEAGTDGAMTVKRADDWMVLIETGGGEAPHDVSISRQWSVGPIGVAVSKSAGEDLRPAEPSAFSLPWAVAVVSEEPAATRIELQAVGDYETGRELFFSEKLQCATCHRIRGAGVGHGPDLSNLTSRDAASVLRDITQPSATINPDYVGYNLRLRNGDEHTGFVRHEGNNRLKVIAATGQETTVAPTAVAEMRPAGLSLMPEGLLDGLNESQVNDLLTFLVHEPPKRDRAEAQRIIGALVSDPARSVASAGDAPDRRLALRVVLVASKQDHGPGQHDYPAWQQSWRPLLARAENVTVEDAWLWPTDEQFAGADALVFYYWNRTWDDAKYAQLDAFQARGGGIVVLHSATIENVAPEKLAERIGLAAQPGTVKYRHMPFDLKFIDREHPIMAGLPEQLYFLDEPYWPMIGDRSRIHVLANALNVDGEDRPMMWTFERGRGRVFASIAGHYTWTLDDPVFRLIILRGLDWVTGRERFASVLAR